jgi:hypothetical protein
LRSGHCRAVAQRRAGGVSCRALRHLRRLVRDCSSVASLPPARSDLRGVRASSPTCNSASSLTLAASPLCAPVRLRQLARQLIGLDLSPRMVQRAVGLYDGLVAERAVRWTRGGCQGNAFDAIVAAGVLFGDLAADGGAIARSATERPACVLRRAERDRHRICSLPSGRFSYDLRAWPRVGPLRWDSAQLKWSVGLLPGGKRRAGGSTVGAYGSARDRPRRVSAVLQRAAARLRATSWWPTCGAASMRHRLRQLRGGRGRSAR